MEWVLELLRQAGLGIGQLLLQPFYCIAVIFILLLFARQARAERRLFHVRLTAWQHLLLPSLLAGLAAGAVISALSLPLGLALDAQAVYWLWGAALLLLLVRLRYATAVYAAGLLGVAQWALGLFDTASLTGAAGRLAASLAALDTAGLLLLAALLHLAEAGLVRWQGRRLSGPLFVEGKRGRLVGGYLMQSFWPVPLLVLVPGAGGGAVLPWTPLLWDGAGQPWALLGIPALIGFSGLATSRLPGDKARSSAARLLWSGLAALASAAAAAWWPPLLPAAALLAPILHEWNYFAERRKEAESSPLFVHDGRGMRILAVAPDMPAAQMGLVPGEILHKVNGVPVTTQEELYRGLHENSAFCKLEVYNLDGQIKFAQRARFEGEHHQLGVVLAPDERTLRVAEGEPLTVIDLLRRRKATRNRDTSSPIAV